MNKYLLIRMVFGLYFLLSQISALSSEGLPVQNNNFLPLAKYIKLLEDAKDSMTIDDVQSQAASFRFKNVGTPESALEFGHSHSAWWLKIVLRNERNTRINKVVEIANSHLSYVKFYQPINGGGYKEIATGNLERFETRPKLTRYFVFPIEIDPNSSATYYIKIKSTTQLFIPVSLWGVDEYNQHERRDYSFQFFYLGIVIAIAFFSLLYYFAMQDRLYLKYLILILFINFTVYSLNGIIKEYINYDSAFLSKNSAAFGAAISIALLLNFMCHFLSMSRINSDLDKIIKYVALIYPLPMFAVSLYPQRYMVLFGQILTILIIVSAMLLSLYLSIKKQKMAYLFLLAYLIPFVVLFVNLLSASKYISQIWDVAKSTQISFLVEMVVFSIALVYRTYQIRKKNEVSQGEIISLQNKIVESLRENESKLESIIAKRYKELRHLIDMLSHEIRTPMSVIRMFIDMGGTNPNLKSNAIVAISDIDGVIERCIETDQLDHGSIFVNLESCDVNSLVQDVCDLRPDASRIKLNPQETAVVTTDQLLLLRIISNLIDNALKYSPVGSMVYIDVQQKLMDNSAGVQIMIRNYPDAAGLPDQHKVFEKYYRSHGAHAKTGSGLGLYLVQRFTELLDAKITYYVKDSQVVFDFWIPR